MESLLLEKIRFTGSIVAQIQILGEVDGYKVDETSEKSACTALIYIDISLFP